MYKFFQLLLVLIITFFTISCSDSKPDRLLQSLSDDLNTTTLDINRNIQISVYAHFDDASQERVEDELLWKSSDESLATVSKGLVSTFSKKGTVTISYQTVEEDLNGVPLFQKEYVLNIKELELQSITLSESSINMYEGSSKSVMALGHFEDDITLDITNDCEWNSQNSAVSSVDNTTQKGVITAISEGNTSIMATNADQSASVTVQVKKIEYVSLKINSERTVFNVEQTIKLIPTATTSDNEEIILDNDAVEYFSSDSTVISLNENIALAEKKGTSSITAKIISNDLMSDAVVLTVDQDEYVRIWKNDSELSFPYAANEEYEELPSELDSFKLKAVGKDFKLSALVVTDFSANIVDSNRAYFDGIVEGETLNEGVEVEYKLVHDATLKELHFYYKVNDSFNNSFSQKYKELD